MPDLTTDLFNDTYDQKQLYNFTGATKVHQLSQGTKRNDVYALQVAASEKELFYEGLLTEKDKIKQLGSHVVTASGPVKVKLSYMIAREGPRKGPLVSNNYGS